MNYRIVLGVNAGVILAIGASLLVPLGISLLYRDGSWASFVLPAAVMLAVGGAGFRLAREPRGASKETTNLRAARSATRRSRYQASSRPPAL